MTKLKILGQNVNLYFSSDHGGDGDVAEWHTANTPVTKIYAAMDTYAAQDAVGFAEWIIKARAHWSYYYNVWSYDGSVYTTAELHKLFKQQNPANE